MSRPRLLLDASSVIALARLGILGEIRAGIGELHVTAAVFAEATVAGRLAADAVQLAVAQGWITVLDPPSSAPLSGLGAGEVATIHEALATGMTAAIDDRDARRAAAAAEVRLTGTIALLVRFAELGGAMSVAESLDRLDEMGFRVSAAVRAWALGQASEPTDASG